VKTNGLVGCETFAGFPPFLKVSRGKLYGVKCPLLLLRILIALGDNMQ